MNRRFFAVLMLVVMLCPLAVAEDTQQEEKTSVFDSIFGGIGDWFSNTANDIADWTTNTANDVADWTSNAATDVWNWTSQAAVDAWNWTSGAVSDAWVWATNTTTDAWNGVVGFFNPPDTHGNPNIPQEPELAMGTNKMFLGYGTRKTGLDNGYYNTLEIGRGDPHYNWELGRFYVSGFTQALSYDNEHFVFLKTLGDNMELRFALAQDIDMLNGDSFLKVNNDTLGYDKEYGIPATDFGRGTLIVYFTDYQNNRHEPQIYRDYLSAKMTDSADTVVSLNEEGDYEVILDYEIKQDSYTLGTALTKSSYHDYKLAFKFSVRNGNCMVFPFEMETGRELRNEAVAPNGFYLDLALSRYLDINVKRSVLTKGSAGMVEDIRFNRPAKDGENYTDEGIYTITVHNSYTGEETTKRLYVGKDEQIMNYVSQGYTVEQIMDAESKN